MAKQQTKGVKLTTASDGPFLYCRLSKEEMALLDDWRFGHKIKTRAEAVRKMIDCLTRVPKVK